MTQVGLKQGGARRGRGGACGPRVGPDVGRHVRGARKHPQGSLSPPSPQLKKLDTSFPIPVIIVNYDGFYDGIVNLLEVRSGERDRDGLPVPLATHAGSDSLAPLHLCPPIIKPWSGHCTKPLPAPACAPPAGVGGIQRPPQLRDGGHGDGPQQRGGAAIPCKILRGVNI